MKILSFIFLIIIVNACSYNKDSKYWSQDNIKRINDEKKLDKIIKKSNDIISLTYDEYKMFIDDYTKKSKYPEVSN